MGPIRILFKGDQVGFRNLRCLLAGSHVDIEISGSAHGHSRGHRAVLDGQGTGYDLKHGGTGLYGNIVSSIFQVRCGYRNEAHGVNRLFRSGLIAGGNGGF